MTKTVGIVGAGTMGSAIARNLIAAGFPVVGRDVDPARADALAAMGGRPAPTARAVAEEADAVMTSLPSIASFEEVTCGADGIAAADRPGLVVFDTSTLPIAVKEAARARLAETGKILLDTPLSGTGAQAVNRDLVVYASGDSAAIAGLGDVFDGFARAHYDLGAFGNGSRMKFVANLLVAVHNVAAGEAFALGIKAGLSPETIFEVISNSAGTSRMFEIRGPQMVANDYSEASMSIGLWRKDMEVIGDFAAEIACSVPLFAAAGQVYVSALAQGRAAEDTASVCAVLESLAGIERSGSANGAETAE